MSPILIVDDNAFFRKTLKNILRSRWQSLEIFEAGDGMEAIEFFKRQRPAIILLDIKLPGENGIEVMKKIKAVNPDTAVIILTGYDTPEYEEAAFASGADYFLSKRTASASGIIDALDKIMRNRESHR
jgi:YesN/AraC family two-component response regulator